MAVYSSRYQSGMSQVPPPAYESAASYSYLRDPMDRFGSPAPTGYAAGVNTYATSRPLPQNSSYAELDHDSLQKKSRSQSPWNPRTWSKRRLLVFGLILAVILLVVIIVAAVEATQGNSSYPDYSALSYSLQDTYEGSTFYDTFDYWDTYDPAAGFVHYDNPTDAANRNLTGYSSSSQTAFLRVDNDEEDATTGRHSARVYSQSTYDQGLFLFDVKHTPYGCGSWPAVWLTNQDSWPDDGEIDIIEAVNQGNRGNRMTLHTTKGCTMSNVKRKMTGTSLQGTCLNSTNGNAGCGVKGVESTFGEAFNELGGGVYAMELRDEGIRMWLFYRDEIPDDITAGTPDPSTWSEAIADFPSTDCDISSHFKNLSIVANIDVCGSWAGATKVYSTQYGCPSNCTAYAAANPSAFDNSYWQFNYFKVFQAS